MLEDVCNKLLISKKKKKKRKTNHGSSYKNSALDICSKCYCNTVPDGMSQSLKSILQN